MRFVFFDNNGSEYVMILGADSEEEAERKTVVHARDMLGVFEPVVEVVSSREVLDL